MGKLSVQTNTFPKKTIRDVPLHGKTVLVRADYNVPLEDDGTIADDYRLTQSLPTINYLLEQDCKVVICSHLGRPEGKINLKYTLEPVAVRLSELLGQTVNFVPVATGDRVVQAVKKLGQAQVLLLENVRFYPGEEADDMGFAKQLAKDTGAAYFVQDGFGVVHRAHASTDAITHCLPSVSGLLLEKEFISITGAMENPKKPLVAVLGGAKVEDKITVIERFIDVADHILIGGAMANTFLKFKGQPIGKSVHEDDLDETMQRIYEKAEAKVGPDKVDKFILLPVDVAVATEIAASQPRKIVEIKDVAKNQYILDLGPRSIEAAVAALKDAGTAVWSGTMGYAELAQFSHGSARIALQLAQQPQTTSVVGGGDTVDFVLHWDAKKGGSFGHVSTGGSASLELMAGKKLPGIEALMAR